MKMSAPFFSIIPIVLNIVFALLTLTSHGQTTKEIIDNHIKAMGGKAKLDAILTYSFNIGDNVVTYKKPGKWNMIFKDSGKVVKTEIYYGEKGWEAWKDGRTGTTTFGVDFDYFIPSLLSYAASPGYKIVNPGPDPNSDNLRIIITSLVHNTMQASFTFFINPATFMITKVQENNMSNSYTFLFEDYKIIRCTIKPRIYY